MSSDGSKARDGNCDTRLDYYKAMSNIRSKIKLIQNQKISVYLVEDYHLIRKSIKLMVNKAEDISIIGDFDNAEDFLEAFERIEEAFVRGVSVLGKEASEDDLVAFVLTRFPRVTRIQYDYSKRSVFE